MPAREESDDEARHERRRAMRATLATGSARVRYAMEANPPELADYEIGEGVADFRERRSRVAYTGARPDGPSTGGGDPLFEQVTAGHVTICESEALRVNGSRSSSVSLRSSAPAVTRTACWICWKPRDR